METSLFFKTFVVFGSQLGLLFGACYYFIFEARKSVLAGEKFLGETFEAKYNKKGELDLFSPEQEKVHEKIKNLQSEIKELYKVKGPIGEFRENEKERVKKVGELKNKIQEEAFNGPLVELQVMLMTPWFLTLLLTVFLSFSEISIWIKMLSLTAATAMFAPLLGIILISMDENDGLRMIKLTVLLTFVTAIVGMYSGIDFSALGYILIIPLGILVTWNFLSIFYNFSSWKKRAMGFFGAITFIFYLLFDFNRLQQQSDAGVNNWNTAFEIGFSIYLDVINLLLELLEAMG